ncbi:beta/gamma crystallin-related protein [Nostoc sp. ChiVER01]|uniref:beta/gamma crystallin-related protein n=1 Tax=Nostoc sp. ChiVER01 TaxID=3075382 RepID=UPI002AD57943|nr:beta/gamma crystallin-related protein [Nostoc sp. ChiVER01]MDZ8221520.1 beta/gamma crystallin-related protein [Nostoc sp. ChiVER01]
MFSTDKVICSSEQQLFTELTPEEGAIIEGGADLELYNGDKFRGLILATNKSRKNVGDTANDLTTSAIVKRGTWLLWTGANYTGTSRRVGVGKYPNLFFDIGLPNDSISSVQRVK